MYDFLRIQYELCHLTPEQLRTYAPRWITAEHAEEILAAEHPGQQG